MLEISKKLQHVLYFHRQLLGSAQEAKHEAVTAKVNHSIEIWCLRANTGWLLKQASRLSSASRLQTALCSLSGRCFKSRACITHPVPETLWFTFCDVYYLLLYTLCSINILISRGIKRQLTVKCRFEGDEGTSRVAGLQEMPSL